MNAYLQSIKVELMMKGYCASLEEIPSMFYQDNLDLFKYVEKHNTVVFSLSKLVEYGLDTEETGLVALIANRVTTQLENNAIDIDIAITAMDILYTCLNNLIADKYHVFTVNVSKLERYL